MLSVGGATWWCLLSLGASFWKCEIDVFIVCEYDIFLSSKVSNIILNHCCDVTLLLKMLILFKETTVIQLILKIIHTVDSLKNPHFPSRAQWIESKWIFCPSENEFSDKKDSVYNNIHYEKGIFGITLKSRYKLWRFFPYFLWFIWAVIESYLGISEYKFVLISIVWL